MPLLAGEKVGPYEILSPLGAGGMGEVYRGRDTRLDRYVAIKVLPEHIAKRGDLRQRFELEARAVASLNHPHICTLYDIGNQDGAGYMVMELLEGETLEARIGKGAIPLEQSLGLAAQIADALDRAHRAGVTHRDVKPQNIMLTRDGVKVLDFGLAKSTSKPGPTEQTLTKALTAEGTVLGTPQYMAPEQFEGKEADTRSDIWAFGAVLYEMVTGQKAFQGKNYSSLVGAILGGEPAPMAVKAFTPAWLERLVRRCLSKDPEDRYQSVRDIVLDLRTPPQESISPAKPSQWPWFLAATVVFALATIVLGVVSWRGRQPVERPMVRMEANLEASDGPGVGAILSPDGKRLVYVSADGRRKPQLWIRRMDQPKAVPLEGTADAIEPFFSPDGQWIAFSAEGKLKKVSVEGGAALTLCDTPEFRGGSWGEDGSIIATLHRESPLMKVPAAGGKPEPVTQFDTKRGEIRQRWPQVLPGGNAVLFTSQARIRNYDNANIDVWSFKDGKRKTVHQGGAWARYLPTGHLIYLHQSTLFAVPFDLGRLEKTGNPVPVLEDVARNERTGRPRLDYSLTGDMVYQTGSIPDQEGTIQWLDSAGKMEGLVAKLGVYGFPRFSPDGKRLALEDGDYLKSDIWVYWLQRDTMTRLTFGGNGQHFPVWSPGGNYVIYQILGQGIFRVKADGAGKPELLVEGKSVTQTPYSISPDGRRLSYMEAGNQGTPDLMTVALDSDGADAKPGKPEPFLKTEFVEIDGVFSPDGRWMAYVSNESGSAEVYVRPFPDTGVKWMISNGGGRGPVWSPSGRELYFMGADNRLMVASYSAKAGSFRPDKPRVWSETRIVQRGIGMLYDLAPDGKRFAVVVPAGEVEQRPNVTFLFHFFDELKRRVPVN